MSTCRSVALENGKNVYLRHNVIVTVPRSIDGWTYTPNLYYYCISGILPIRRPHNDYHDNLAVATPLSSVHVRLRPCDLQATNCMLTPTQTTSLSILHINKGHSMLRAACGYVIRHNKLHSFLTITQLYTLHYIIMNTNELRLFK